MRPPLLFIHGMWSTPAVFARVRAALEADGWETLAPALPFHDRDPSLPPPEGLGRLGIEDYAAYLVEIIRGLRVPPVIIGHSMGGMLAQCVAARVQHAGLVLLSTAGTAATPAISFDQLKTMKSVVLRWGWWEDPTRIEPEGAMWGIYNNVPEEVARAEIKALVWDSGRVLAEIMLPSLSKTRANTVDLAKLKAPALIVVGCEDRITLASVSRAVARKLGGVIDYHELPQTGHWLFWGDAEARTIALMQGWLARQFVDAA